MYALDIDSVEIENTRKRLASQGFNEDILTIKNINFKDLEVAVPKDIKLDFLLADLGVSSMQIDNPSRGFSFKNDGPLDLRLNPNAGTPASLRLCELTLSEIEGMLIENSDEPYAHQIALEIIRAEKNGPIETTFMLRDVVSKALKPIVRTDFNEVLKKTCQRVMQAIRIDVNSEFEVLYDFLEALPKVMKSGGRIAILTFHSGEDRLVKKAFKEGLKNGIYKEVSRDVLRPSAEECFRNPRAKSTKMRYAIVA